MTSASATFERVDGGGDCAGLVPARDVAPVTVRRSPPAGAACLGGTSDGTGAVAVGARTPGETVSWQCTGATAPHARRSPPMRRSRVVLREAGTGCTTGAVDQGWDGTVVQQSGKDACTYRYWPGLLGR